MKCRPIIVAISTALFSLGGPALSAETTRLTPIAPVEAEGFKSPVGEQYAGKIVFSKKPINRGPKSDARFVSSFKLRKDKIFLRTFVSASAENQLRKTGWQCASNRRITTDVSVNGGPPTAIDERKLETRDWGRYLTWSLEDDRTIHLTKGPLKYGAKTDYRYDFAMTVVPQLKDGQENSLVFSSRGSCEADAGDKREMKHWEMAVGTLTLTVGKRGRASFTKRVGPLLPKNAMRGGAALAKRAMRAVAKKWPTEQVLAARVTSTEWDSSHSRRSIDAVVVVREKGAAECRIFDLSFHQKGVRGRYQNAMTFSVGGDEAFPCVNAKR
ncbi:MAG: hypothetical protein ACI9MR_003261 [Myxococcota bacterium]|jgi:hypothetical protein